MSLTPVPASKRYVSPGGRVFHLRGRRCEPFGAGTWEIDHEGEQAGLLFRGDTYGRTEDGHPRWHASTRDLYWRLAGDAPVGVGFDVAAYNSPEECMAAWLRSADEILDWAEGKSVGTLYGVVRKTEKKEATR